MREVPHIVFMIGGLSRGGIETHLVDTTIKLKQEDVRISVMLLFDRGPLLEKLIFEEIDVIYPKKPISGKIRIIDLVFFGVATHLYRCYLFLKSNRPDVVHTFLPSDTIVGGLLAKCAGIQHIVASRVSRNFYQRERPIQSLFEKIILKNISLILGNSKAVVEDLLHEGIPKERVKLVYTGIDVSKFMALDRHRARKNLRISDSSLILANVANLIPYKGHVDLLCALNNIQSKLPEEWGLLIIGRDDGIGEQLSSLVDEYGLAENIRFLGSRDDVPQCLGAADFGILTSHTEGFSNAILEYMASGLPVVVTNVGGNKEAVSEKEGIVVKKGDVKGIGEAILRLSRDSLLRYHLGQSGIQKVAECFSVDYSVDKYCETYRELALQRSNIDRKKEH